MSQPRHRWVWTIALGVLVGIDLVWLGASYLSVGEQSSSETDTASSRPSYPNVFYHTVPTLLGTDELTVKADLPVRNPWDREIQVENIASSCGCTMAEIRDKTIGGLAASALHVEVKFPPHGGTREVKCVLNLADGGHLIHVVKAAAYPLVTIDSETGVIDLGKTLPKSARSSIINLQLRGDIQSGTFPKITSLAAEDDKAESLSFRVIDRDPKKVELEPGDIASHPLQLSIDLRSGAQSGFQNATLSIAFEHPNAGRGTLKVPIRWYVSQVINVRPDRAFLSVGTTDSSPVYRTFLVSRTDGEPFEILAADTSVDWVKSRGVGKEPGAPNVLRVEVEINPSLVPARAYSELTVRTDFALQPIIRIPISVALMSCFRWNWNFRVMGLA